MLTQAIWVSTVLLEALVLIQGVRRGVFRQYPLFYIYLLYVLLEEGVRFAAYHWWSAVYARIYWDTQFLSVTAGCLVIFEIYRVGLRDFPGTARMARNLLLFVFAMVFAKAIVTSTEASSWWAALTAVKLERDLRIVQASALLAIAAVFLIYAIPLSRNLKGVAVGYGIFLGASVLQLTLMVELRGELLTLWPYLRSFAYVLVLLVWVFALWSYREAPRAQGVTLDEDYKVLVAGTRQRLEKTRLALGRVVRP